MNAGPMWMPQERANETTHLAAFQRFIAERHGVRPQDYEALHRWSIDERGDFWSAVWDYCGVRGNRGSIALENADAMPGCAWFPEARLNYARNLLRRRDDGEAIVFRGEEAVQRRISYADLYREVSACVLALRRHGVEEGDRVVAYMPNLPETIVIMLAAAAIGAVFSSASPDFGVQGVVDRFGQIQPKALFAADGALYASKRLSSLERVASIRQQLPCVELLVIVPYIHRQPDIAAIPCALLWDDFLGDRQACGEIDFADLPFAHPLCVLYSSGTTGMPKCIVHGAGGTLLQHLKEHQLHADVHPGDRLFYYTTCGWMMWNWLASGLASGATLMLYDGAAFAADGAALWDYCAEEHITHFGVSAKYLDAAAKAGLCPVATHKLDALRMIMSTGSPLAPEGFDYVYRDVKADVCLASISGGTDIVSCFVLGNPCLPVWRGEIQCKGLGMAVEVFNDTGTAVIGEKGELVCVKPFPSMPIGFWNDSYGSRYRSAYFSRFPSVWCHGDWCEETAHHGLVIQGRSDATLNPGGVRIGTAEIYREVERLPEVVESIVVGQDWDHDIRVILFVRLREGLKLDAALENRIRFTLRNNASPRHVPHRILQVADIPRTRSGKLVELAVRSVLHGNVVKNLESLANPEALECFRNRRELAQ